MKIALLDTSVCSENLGDFIIMDSVRSNVDEMFPTAMVLHTATHEKISKPSYRLLRDSNFAFVGGTNLISSNMHWYNQWKINLGDVLRLKNVILMGVGWWQYQAAPNIYTRLLLKSVLHHELIHSVRDTYTESKLKEAGIKNVVNTGCPTMWRLDGEHCAKIPIGKADCVVVTLTDYKQNPTCDSNLIALLLSLYEQVFIWPQGAGDLEYIRSLNLSGNLQILNPSVRCFNDLLSSDLSIDYVGTRLHAGIRSLQLKRRSIILAVDNRATEKAKDFNFAVCPREDIVGIQELIESNSPTQIALPLDNIISWKSQFT